MNAALRETFADEGVRRQLEEAQQARLILSEPAALGTFLDGQVETWGRVVRDHNVRPD